MHKPDEHPPGRDNRWFRQPIAWLGIFITAVLLAFCTWTLVVGLSYTDVAMHGDTPTFMGVPVSASSAPAPVPTPPAVDPPKR